MTEIEADLLRNSLRKGYSKIIKLKEFGLQNCIACFTSNQNTDEDILGYSKQDYIKAPQEANLALGCANPKNYANYKLGETVLDLGCGAGFDCFLAAHEVGKKGKVIGVDMMTEMLSKARQIAHDYSYKNVEFRLGEIEHLPIEDKSIDIIISNCVLNLSPNKEQVMKECKRVMKENARILILDVVLDDSFTHKEKIKPKNTNSCFCLENALTFTEIKNLLKQESFNHISIDLHHKSKEIINSWIKDEPHNYYDKIYSAIISANL